MHGLIKTYLACFMIKFQVKKTQNKIRFIIKNCYLLFFTILGSSGDLRFNGSCRQWNLRTSVQGEHVLNFIEPLSPGQKQYILISEGFLFTND